MKSGVNGVGLTVYNEAVQRTLNEQRRLDTHECSRRTLGWRESVRDGRNLRKLGTKVRSEYVCGSYLYPPRVMKLDTNTYSI